MRPQLDRYTTAVDGDFVLNFSVDSLQVDGADLAVWRKNEDSALSPPAKRRGAPLRDHHLRNRLSRPNMGFKRRRLAAMREQDLVSSHWFAWQGAVDC